MKKNIKKVKIVDSFKVKRKKFLLYKECTCDELFLIILKIIFIFLLLIIFRFFVIKNYNNNLLIHLMEDTNTSKDKKDIKSKDELNNIKSDLNNIENEKISNYINIGINIDNKYIYPCIVFLTSLLNNRAKSTFYIIHILTNTSLRNDTYNKVNEVIKQFGKNFCNVSYYDMGEQFKGATSGEYISTAAYYRISLPSLLHNVDKLIYCDTDVINFEDLSEMYKIQLDNNTYFCGALDFVGLIGEVSTFVSHIEKYMNSGIIIMNLQAMRNNGIEEKIRQFVSNHFLNHHEQTAINAICYDNFKILPYKYATFALFNSTDSIIKFNNEQNEKYRYNESELIQAFYQPVSLHYAGWTKPWHKKYNLMNSAYWWYYAKKSGFYEEILEHYEFLKNDTEAILKTIPSDGGLLKRNYKK